MDEQTFDRQRLSFGAIADTYDQVRPSYPAAALRWALGTRPATVVDLGAGTGLLTQVLAELGHRVIAVDPDQKMRAILRRRLPRCPVVGGSAEQIPMADATADAVVVGQAYHWFEPELAHAEIARVLRPGGVFAPMWNLRDDSVAWVARLSRVAGIERDGSMSGTVLSRDAFGEALGPAEHRDFEHSRTHTAGSLLALVRSRSWYLTATVERQTEIEAAVQALSADLPSTFELPYLTRAYRAARR